MVRVGRLPRGSHGSQALFEEEAANYFDAISGEALDGNEAAVAAKVFAATTGAMAVYVGSVTGQPLDSALVEEARALELE